jgi:hypothetical protein
MTAPTCAPVGWVGWLCFHLCTLGEPGVIIEGLRDTGNVARLTRGLTVEYNDTPALSCDPTVSLSKNGTGPIGSAVVFKRGVAWKR